MVKVNLFQLFVLTGLMSSVSLCAGDVEVVSEVPTYSITVEGVGSPTFEDLANLVQDIVQNTMSERDTIVNFVNTFVRFFQEIQLEWANLRITASEEIYPNRLPGDLENYLIEAFQQQVLKRNLELHIAVQFLLHAHGPSFYNGTLVPGETIQEFVEGVRRNIVNILQEHYPQYAEEIKPLLKFEAEQSVMPVVA